MNRSSDSFSECLPRFLMSVLAAAVIASRTLIVLVSVSAAQTVSDVYTFTGTNSSADPFLVTPAQGRDGTLYGTTAGQNPSNFGTIFKIATTGAFRSLYAFDGTSGSTPFSGLTLASDGNFYGTASSGGSGNNGVL